MTQPEREGMVFLPEDAAEAGVGMVRLSGDDAGRLYTGADRAAGPDAFSRMERAAFELEQGRGTMAWRGLLAFCLLAGAWEGAAQLTVRRVAGVSSFAAAVLGEDKGIDLLLVRRGERQALLGVADRRVGVIPAAQGEDLTGLVPERARFFDGGWNDPTALLNPRDRDILIRRLSLLRTGGSPAVQRFLTDLTREGLRPAREMARQEEDARQALLVRLKAVIGLMPEAGMTGLERVTEGYTESSENPLMACLGLEAARRDCGPMPALYLWQGVPFARDSAVTGLESLSDPREGEALAALAEEIGLLERYSPRFRREMASRLRTWLEDRQGDAALSPAVRTLLQEARQELTTFRCGETPCLRWPWKRGGAQEILWREAVGDGLGEGFAMPFADRLCVIPGGAGEVFDDPVLRVRCMLPDREEEPACAVLPPLSMALAACAKDMVRTDSFRFCRTEEGGAQVCFTLRGAGEVSLARAYAPEEIRVLAPEEVPTLALWPALPLPEAVWRDYAVYLHGGTLRAAVLCGGNWLRTEDRLFSVLKTETFPSMAALCEGDACLGVVPCLLPPCHPAAGERAVGVLEMGASGIRMALRQGVQALPVRVPCLVKVLLQGGRSAPLAEEFLPLTPLGPVMPAAAELFADAQEPCPLADGHIPVGVDCRGLAARGAQRLHSRFLEGTSPAGRRARHLALRQCMELVSLQAVLNGAPSISWRLALPDGGPAKARAELWREVCHLAPLVARDTGLPLNDETVRHADASLALGHYVRGEGGVKGGFLAMDAGGNTAVLSLWLRGMNRPAMRCVLPLGMRAMLCPLIGAPDCLAEDFADMPEGTARESVMLLSARLRGVRGSLSNLGLSQLLMDRCLGDHGPALAAHMNARLAQGRMTVTQALLTLGFSAMFALAGLMQEEVFRDPLLNDYLPAEMTLLLAGRGGEMFALLPEGLRSCCIRMARLEMSREHPVRGGRVQHSAAKGCEAVLGLCRMAEVREDEPGREMSLRASGAPPMPVELLLLRFLAAFRQMCPEACGRLYTGMFDASGLLTAEAESAVRAFAGRALAGGAEPECALASCLTGLVTLGCGGDENVL